MTLDQNDWRLTAYALNELDDADRAEVEAAVAGSPELARTVDEIRATVGVLQTALADAEIATERRSDEATKGKGGPHESTELPSRVRPAVGRGLRRVFLPFAAAASIILAATIGWYTLSPSLSRSRELVSLSNTHSLRPAQPGTGTSLHALGYVANGGQGPSGGQGAVTTDGKDVSGARWYGFNPTASAGPTPSANPREAIAEEEKEIYRSIERAVDQGAPVPPELIARLKSIAVGGEVQGLVSKEKQVRQQQQMQLRRAPEGSASLLIGSRGGEGLSPEAVEKLTSLGYLGGAEGKKEQETQGAYALKRAIPSPVRAEELAEYIRLHTEGPRAMQLASAGGHDGLLYFQDQTGTITIEGPVGAVETIDELMEGLRPEAPGFEDYRAIQENPFRLVESDPLSTFSIDVDTAAYANVRRWITGGSMPPPDAVRIEEMINYFDYAYPQPVDEHPFAVHVEVAQCPWNGAHRLARIGIKGYEIAPQERPPANLVFLIDVSGSMQPPNKLPLLREALGLMVDELHRDDTVGIVVYAGASGIVLSPSNNKDVIRGSINGLMAGGGTNGAAGIEAAYQLAQDTFVEGGINRVILATDGDFNVGVTGSGDLQRLIEEKAKSGVFLTVLGFGMGNLKDGTLETLADKGNGNYAYIDTLSEARKVLIEQMEGTLVTIAKDVKIQVEFNPLAASAYRLIGYENRVLAAQDFNDDKKDAGEIGAGHTVTALYEIVPAGLDVDVPPVDALKYQTLTEFAPAADSGELMTVKLRYKEPDGDESKLIEMPVRDGGATFAESSDDFAFAASVAAFGMLLRHSEHAGSMTYAGVAEFAEGAKGEDFYGYRAEFIDLVRRAEAMVKAP